MKNKLIAAFAISSLAFGLPLQANQISGTMGVTAEIGDGCEVSNVNTAGGANDFGELDFGMLSSLSAFIDAQGGGTGGAGFQLTCSDGLGYQIGLDNGLYASGGERRMSDGTNFINYELYKDASRADAWGAIGSSDELTDTGSGAQKSHVVYGRIPPGMTPAAGSYSDTVQVTVTW